MTPRNREIVKDIANESGSSFISAHTRDKSPSHYEFFRPFSNETIQPYATLWNPKSPHISLYIPANATRQPIEIGLEGYAKHGQYYCQYIA